MKVNTPNFEKAKQIYATAGDIMAYPLSVLFNTSMSSGVVPEDWKLANLKPIFKKGTRASASNYRPISLPSVACRIMECCIKGDLIRHLEEYNLINESQHGFRSGKSKLTNLLEYTEWVTEAVDKGYEVYVIYFDFKKAFDKVPHKKLLMKVQASGIQGYLLEWLTAWLSRRKPKKQGGEVGTYIRDDLIFEELDSPVKENIKTQCLLIHVNKKNKVLIIKCIDWISREREFHQKTYKPHKVLIQAYINFDLRWLQNKVNHRRLFTRQDGKHWIVECGIQTYHDRQTGRQNHQFHDW